ncbi:MAG TPA: acyl-CoA dehydrogenase family protein [Mycobacteriales bacterium]|nr:acyl-CoA dehydrogenase family protein [Mycobacteriales bacterium]
MTVLETARRIADEVLFPAAAEIDRAPSVPPLQLELLASAGLYGAAAPASVGGADLDLPTFGQVVEALAGGCLATAFVWVQHHGLVRALAGPDAPAGLRADWLGALASGACRAGAAYGGLLPGPPALRATPTRAGGWLLSGQSPWVTGWGLVDVLHVAARGPEDTVVWLVVDAVERPGLVAHRQRVVAADAAVTVRLEFAGLPVPAARERAVLPWTPPSLDGPPLRTNGSLPLGVAGRCVSVLSGRAGDELRAELDACRAYLDDAVTSTCPEAMPAARAAASELAVRAAAALAVHTGSSSALVGSDAERLTREALFLLVFGTRPQIKASLLDRLSGSG